MQDRTHRPRTSVRPNNSRFGRRCIVPSDPRIFLKTTIFRNGPSVSPFLRLASGADGRPPQIFSFPLETKIGFANSFGVT
jgi:hypothetical protein